MPALDLGPGNGFATLVARYLNRARICELFQIRLYRSLEQRGLRLVGAPCLADQRGVNLGRKFQVQCGEPSMAKQENFITRSKSARYQPGKFQPA